jgi:hypothetical protein
MGLKQLGVTDLAGDFALKCQPLKIYRSDFSRGAAFRTSHS